MSRATKGFLAFLRSENRGTVAIAFAFSLVPILGAAGAALDYSHLTVVRAELKTAADAAALAGARKMLDTAGQTTAARESAGSTMATAVVSSKAPAAQKSVAAVLSSRTVTVNLAQTEALLFGAFLSGTAASVIVESKAIFNDQRDCMILLDNTGIALDLNSRAKVQMGCGLHVNSKSTPAVFLNSDSHIKAGSVCTAGSVQMNGGGSVSPVPKTACPTVADPLASLPEPPETSAPCGYTNDIVVNAGQTKPLSPGVYCNKLEVNGGTITLNPGIYVFRDTLFKLNSGGKATGTGVMIFLMGKEGRLELASNSTLELSAPTSGTYAGIVMFQSRNPITLQTDYHQLNAGSGMKLEGTVYMPNGQIRYNSQASSTNTAAWTAYVVRRLQLNADATINVNNNYSAGPPLPAGMKGLSSSALVWLTQ
jgi:Flp pilus assembly protein TadG